MRYRDAPAFRQALEQRLKTRAGGDGARLARDRKRVVFDRLLARLGAVAPGRWLLKGGFALDLRLAERARPTKDVDIEWRSDVDELLDTLIEAADHDAGDFFAFAVERTNTPADRLGGSHRFRVSVALAAPVQLPPPPTGWEVPFRQLAEEVSAPTDLAAGHATAAALLNPVLSAEVTSGIWDPSEQRWRAPEPEPP